LTLTGTQVSYSAPLLPGTNQVIYSYVIPCNSDSLRLDWKINYNVSRYDLLILNQDVRVSGAKLNTRAILNLGGSLYQDYSSQKFTSWGCSFCRT